MKNSLSKYLVGFAVFFAVFALGGQEAQAATAAPGDIIKSSGSPGVYYYAADGQRYLFPNEKIYMSWYNDFEEVVTISPEELAAIPFAGRNVVYRAGTHLIKITTDPKVYAVQPGGVLRWVKTEEIAKTLWGNKWSKRVHDLPDAFYSNYTKGKAISEAKYPVGSFVTTSAGNSFYIPKNGQCRKVTDEAREANRLRNAFFAKNANLGDYEKEEQVESYEGVIADIFYGDGVNVSSSGLGSRLAVALSADSPGPGVVYVDSEPSDGTQALKTFARFNFSAARDGDIVVTEVKVTQTGLSSSYDIGDAYLFADGQAVAEAASYEDKVITFANETGLFKVQKGKTKEIWLRANVTNGVSKDKTIIFGIHSAQDISTSSDAIVGGTFPLLGASMRAYAVDDLVKVTFEEVSGPSSVDVGDSGAEIFRMRAKALDHNVRLKRLDFTMVGSAQRADLENFKLYYGDNQIGNTVKKMDASRRVEFRIAGDGYRIPAEDLRNFYVTADIKSGLSRNFYVSINSPADIFISDEEYGVLVKPNHSDSFSIFRPQSVALIDTGRISIERERRDGSLVAHNASNSLIASFKVKAKKEDAMVSSFKMRAVLDPKAGKELNPSDIINVKVFLNGQQLGSTRTFADREDVLFELSNEFFLKKGKENIFKIKAQIRSSDEAESALAKGDFITFKVSQMEAQALTTLEPARVRDFQSEKLAVGENVIRTYTSSGMADASASSPTASVGDKKVLLGRFVIDSGNVHSLEIKQINIKDGGRAWGQEFDKVFLVKSGDSPVADNYLAPVIYPKGDPGTSYSFTLKNPYRIPADALLTFDLYAYEVLETATTGSAFVGAILDSVAYQHSDAERDDSHVADKTGQKIYFIGE